MARRTRRVVTDKLWSRVEPHLPVRAARPKGGRSWVHDTDCLEGILWVLWTGARWGDIPVDLPSPSTCWRRGQGGLPGRAPGLDLATVKKGRG